MPVETLITRKSRKRFIFLQNALRKTVHLTGIAREMAVQFRNQIYSCNRPLALRGYVINASLKQRVVIFLMPKIDRAHKRYLTPEI